MLAFSIDYYGIFFGATQSVELFCTYLVTVCLYQKLKDEIADLDEKIMDNLFFFRISASDCNEHDTLFYLKSLDLDRRMGYELGTIYECTHEN